MMSPDSRVPKVAHAKRLAYIRRLCREAESSHTETALLVETLSKEVRFTASAASLKLKRRRRTPTL